MAVNPLVEGWLALSEGWVLARLMLVFAGFSTFFIGNGKSPVALCLLDFSPSSRQSNELDLAVVWISKLGGYFVVGLINMRQGWPQEDVRYWGFCSPWCGDSMRMAYVGCGCR